MYFNDSRTFYFLKPDRWHNGSAFVFCPGDCPFKSPTSADACGEVTGCAPAAKGSACVAPEVDLRECILHLFLQKANKAEATLALKPRGDVNRNPKQGYQWPQNRTCLCVRQGNKCCEKYFSMFSLDLKDNIFGQSYISCPEQINSSSHY